MGARLALERIDAKTAKTAKTAKKTMELLGFLGDLCNANRSTSVRFGKMFRTENRDEFIALTASGIWPEDRQRGVLVIRRREDRATQECDPSARGAGRRKPALFVRYPVLMPEAAKAINSLWLRPKADPSSLGSPFSEQVLRRM
ncbi:MAG: hypothetical protein WBD40_25875 [Tepidisphaeraceae bacterium]